MKFWFAILCFSVAGLHPALAPPGERNPVETDLRRNYEGKLLSLKHPCAGRKLEFDPQGKCLTTCEEVPWTTGGLLFVKQDVAFRSAFPLLLGELAIMLWLVIKGAKVQPLAAPAS